MEDQELDVVVRMLSPSGDPLLTLPLHSRVLSARSSYFAARLSERWQPHPSASNPNDAEMFVVDIIATDRSAAGTYKRCMDLMYVQRKDMNSCHPFAGVDDALCMLRIAAELLFMDCVDFCLEYLEMLCTWTCDDEASIRSTLSSLQLSHMHRDLARRLCLPEVVPANQPTLALRHMLVHLLQPLSSKGLETLDPSEPVPESRICLAWNNLMRTRLCKNLQISYREDLASQSIQELCRFFNNLLALGAADTVLKVFAQDTESSHTIASAFKKYRDFQDRRTVEVFEGMSNLLGSMMQSVECGRVLLSQATRLMLIKTWLPVCSTEVMAQRSQRTITSMMNILSSLPIVDRHEVYRYCMEQEPKCPEELSSSFPLWCDMIRDLHLQFNTGCTIAVVRKDDC